MLKHVILGLLRDGAARHGYELMRDYRERTGTRLSAGNVYRHLGELARAQLVEVVTRPHGVDERRIPYRITIHGREVFTAWLSHTVGQDVDRASWILFVEYLPEALRERALDLWREDLARQAAALERDLAAERSGRLIGPGAIDLLDALTRRRLRMVAADLELADHLRRA